LSGLLQFASSNRGIRVFASAGYRPRGIGLPLGQIMRPGLRTHGRAAIAKPLVRGVRVRGSRKAELQLCLKGCRMPEALRPNSPPTRFPHRPLCRVIASEGRGVADARSEDTRESRTAPRPPQTTNGNTQCVITRSRMLPLIALDFPSQGVHAARRDAPCDDGPERAGRDAEGSGQREDARANHGSDHHRGARE
jgi:hypothetical protein